MHARASYLHQMTSRDGRDEPLHPSSKEVRHGKGERDARAADGGGTPALTYSLKHLESSALQVAASGGFERKRERLRTRAAPCCRARCDELAGHAGARRRGGASSWQEGAACLAQRG